MSASQPGKTPVKKADSNSEELNIHENWVTLIKYCGVAHQNGTLTFATEGGVPMELLETTDEKTKFGKESPEPLFAKEINAALVRIRVTKKWSGLIKFCAESFPYGQVGVRIVAGEPIEPIGKFTKARIRFDHPESFPALVRFYRNEPNHT